jgi:hypothetical protein
MPVSIRYTALISMIPAAWAFRISVKEIPDNIQKVFLIKNNPIRLGLC